MFKGNLGELLRQAQQMGESMRAKQEELANKFFDVSVGGDLVQMRFNGKGEAQSVFIDPSLMKPEEQEVLQDLVLSAVNQGVARAQEELKEELGKMAGGLDIPGLTS